jgi:hypothetical protein
MEKENIKNYFEDKLKIAEKEYNEISRELQEIKLKTDRLDKIKLEKQTQMFELKTTLEYLRKNNDQ